MKKFFPSILITVFLIVVGFFFSYRITQTPPGLTTDEAAFAYNAALLEKTGHDQNGRFMPVFVLSINGADWRQPVSQYFITAFFKIFGPSIFSLRLSTVVILLLSTFLIYFWLSKIDNRQTGIIGSLVFLTTPIVMIQTHMALDNIFPIPFALLWLICLWYFSKTKKVSFLLFAGISLGIGFYTYKAMRAVVPVWCLLTVLFLFLENSHLTKKNITQFIKQTLLFTLGIFPFFAIIPLLELKYPGAVFDSHSFNWSSIYDFLYPYLSSFDLSFLFIKGDDLIYHSTGTHGMFLLSLLPVFLVGLYQGVREKGYWTFLIAVFFFTPLLFGFVDSVHRASRLMAFIPAFVAITSLGIVTIKKLKNKFLAYFLLGVIVIISIFNYSSFVNYYWYTYPKFARSYFLPSNTLENAYVYLSQTAKRNHLIPYIESGAKLSDGETGKFFEAAYFDESLKLWQAEQPLPPNSIVMAKLGHQEHLVTIGSTIEEYNFFVNKGETIID
ncbi:MAG TPA: glycosyltransferase family 39 protein [Candidatus Woesebacteria bacterium]|nr:glycosyltransferase family 39 protein [Candidatus Woesebacteria bacterium]